MKIVAGGAGDSAHFSVESFNFGCEAIRPENEAENELSDKQNDLIFLVVEILRFMIGYRDLKAPSLYEGHGRALYSLSLRGM